MHIGLPAILIIGFLLIALAAFIIIRNLRDEKELEQQLDQDFGKPQKQQDNEDTSA
jgi:large-conductance mechanosensitive channel